MLMRFAMGQAVHAMIQHDWHRIADTSEGVFTFEDEVRIGPDLGGVAAQWNIRSSCDGVITIYEAGEPLVRVGVEIKTKSDKEYAKLKAPEKQHIEQCTTYQATLDLPLMWLIYYNKSNSNFTPSRPPYLFRFDRWRWEEDLEMRFAWATHAAETGLTPDRSEGVYCRWCQFAHTCQPAILNRRSKRGRRR
jgi:CRISPR/Cas system-associated exonuclease Cas4 (RecB family)